jgi:opacity protein-like surface antigen
MRTAPLTSPAPTLAAVRASVSAHARLVMALLLVSAAPVAAQSSVPPLHEDPTVDDCSVRFAPVLTQGAFRRFVREFGSVSAFKQVSSPGTLGKGRVLVGIEMMKFTIDDRADAWNDTFTHPDGGHPLGSTQRFPKLKLRVGVTDDLDVGAFYTKNFEANYGWLGIDGTYRILTEGERAPVSLAVRGAYTKTLYVSDMDMHALTVDVSVGRRLGSLVRPYVGVGADGVLATETSDAVTLRRETVVAPHLLAGIDVSVGRLALGAELTLGARPSVQVQVGAVAF